jgi:hypothetical protein
MTPAIAVAVTSGATGTTPITTLQSDLYINNVFTVTVTGSMGFSGGVNLALTGAADWNVATGSGAPVALGTTGLTDALTLTENGTASATFTLEADGDVADASLASNLAITATPTETTVTAVDDALAVTFNPVVHVEWTIDAANNQGIYDQNHLINNPYKILSGRQLAVFNCSAADATDCAGVTVGTAATQLIVHSDGTTFPHQGASSPPATQASAADVGKCGTSTRPCSTAYVVVPTAGTEEFHWHNSDSLPSNEWNYITTVSAAQ